MAMSTAQIIAASRFGLGPRANEAPPRDPRGWLVSQLKPQRDPRLAATEAAAATVSSAAIGMQTAKTTEQKLAVREATGKAANGVRRQAGQARFLAAVDTDAPLVDRLTSFWTNHFAISVVNPNVATFAGAMAEDAVRPHVCGRFVDMLLAVERHPAMLFYLDQVTSVGPGSPYARRAQAARNAQRGLNENLAREILELHTLGARSGYSQADVTELARALTGWSVTPLTRESVQGTRPPGSYAFLPIRHEPGQRTLLGQRFADDGEDQARAMLEMVAMRPETAKHLATKLAVHFVADDPPAALIERMARAYLDSGGELIPVYRQLIEADEAWAEPYAKFRTPWDWLVASARAIGWDEQLNADVVLLTLGQPLWKPGAPAGWPDRNGDWAAPEAVYRRVEMAQRLAARLAAGNDARALADQVMPEGIGADSRTAIARADSPAQALVLLLASPEMMRR